MQPGHPQATYIIEMDAQRELSKLTEPKSSPPQKLMSNPWRANSIKERREGARKYRNNGDV
jgi:hypothetical protein